MVDTQTPQRAVNHKSKSEEGEGKGTAAEKRGDHIGINLWLLSPVMIVSLTDKMQIV